MTTTSTHNYIIINFYVYQEQFRYITPLHVYWLCIVSASVITINMHYYKNNTDGLS